MLDADLGLWLDAQANGLDTGHSEPEHLLPRLADAGLMRIGVPEALGGNGGQVVDAIDAVASVATHSLAAAFVMWGQRTFIEYLLHTPNEGLRDRLLPNLLAGRQAGATGLSNAMKFLSGIEALQISAQPQGAGWRFDGCLHWVTNLRKQGFVVAAAIEASDGGKPFIMAMPSDAPGLQRSADLELLGLQSTNTAALRVEQVELGREWLLHEDARAWLPTVRPGFLGLQCGMSIGLARRTLDEVARHIEGDRSVLRGDLDETRERLEGLVEALNRGLLDGSFRGAPAAMFKVRIGLADVVAAAVQLELQASGGKAYLDQFGSGFARRLRESAFVPIVTPSLVQLRTELQRQQARTGTA